MDSALLPAAPPTTSASASAAARRDADLQALLARGETQAAFEQLVPRYEAKVYRLCLTLLRVPAAAQDAAQDSLLRVWRALARYDPATAALSTWIYAIARNRCLSLLAAHHGPATAVSLDEVADEVGLIAACAPHPEADASLWLRGLVAALPEAQRRCVTLFYYEERAVAEVAAMLGLPEGTVKTHLHRARAALLQRLQQQGLADASLWLR